MEISSTDIERALSGVNELAQPLASVTAYLMVLRRIGLRRDRRPRGAAVGRCSLFVRRAVSGLGMAVTLSPAAAAAQPGFGHPLHARAPGDPKGLRSEPGRFPPPRLPGPAESPGRGRPGVDSPPRRPVGPGPRAAGATAVRPPWLERGAEPRPDARRDTGAHPAIHAGARGTSGMRLFARATITTPAGSRGGAAAEAGRRIGWHAVLPGETLWSIAAYRLHTDDVRRIARYWPRIHRANRTEIGPNPDLIRPGQVLELPPESA